MSEQTANLCTTDAAESLRAVVAERDREIERLKEGQSILILARDEQKRLANEYRDLWSRAALKAQPSGVVHHNLIEALKFYANGDHLLLADPDAWDTCSGEPINFLHDDAGTASVEDGSIAKAALDSLNSSPVSAGDDAEQAAFEDWLVRVCPSGDADSVHAQWLESSDYEDFCDQAYDIEAERLTAEALGTGAGINPNATSIDDIFLTESAGGVDERE